jgi:hypothetical protein
MKKLLCGLAVLSTFSAFATVDFDGMGRVRSLSTENYDFDGDGKDVTKTTSYRFQMGFKAYKVEQTSVYMQARFNKTAGAYDTGAGKTSSGNLNDPDSFDVHQAYIDHAFNENFSMRAGRQELAYGDHLIIGSVGFHDVGRTFDGYKFGYKSNYGTTDILMMTIQENGTETDSDRDHDLNGIYHSGTFGNVKHVDFYYLVDQNLTAKTTNNDTTVTSTGVRVKSAVKDFDYRVEYTAQTVKIDEDSEAASQYDVELGYTFGKVRMAIETASASEFYKEMYPTGHKWLGFGDLYKRQNITQTAVHLAYTHSEKLNGSLSYHMLSATEETKTTQKWGAAAASDTSEAALGNEIDLAVNYKLGENLGLQAAYVTFAPSDRYASTDAFTLSYLQLTTKF